MRLYLDDNWDNRHGVAAKRLEHPPLLIPNFRSIPHCCRTPPTQQKMRATEASVTNIRDLNLPANPFFAPRSASASHLAIYPRLV